MRMSERAWQDCTDPDRMLVFLRRWHPVSRRKLRLFGCACLRRVEHLVVDQQNRMAIALLERHADDCAEKGELEQALANALDTIQGDGGHADFAVARAIRAGDEDDRFYEAEMTSEDCLRAAAGELGWGAPWVTEGRTVGALLRDVIGPFPFRSVAVDKAWLSDEVLELATDIYTERRFERMPELCELLERAGCHLQEVLGHCRSGEIHVRGCWVLDLLLGKS